MSTILPFESPLLKGMKKIRTLEKNWKIACQSAGIAIKGSNDRVRTPRLSHPRIVSPNGLAVTAMVDMGTVGGTAKQLEGALEIILASVGAIGGRVERLTPAEARLTIEWERRRTLTTTGTLRPGEDDPNTIDISPIYIDLDNARTNEATISLTKSLLVGGESESGKSNLVWHLLSEMNHLEIPYRLTVIDPAGGVELNDLQSSPFTRRYIDRAYDVEKVIAAFHSDMEKRLEWMKSQRIRTHNPSPTRPLEILVIDEILLCRDQLKAGVLSPLGEILSVGRKARFIVWACTQLGQKEVIGTVRDLFTQRVCMRTRTQEATDAILGTGATGDGAKCHRITRPGEGYVFTDSSGTYTKFYAPLVVETASVAAGGVASPLIVPTNRARPTHRSLKKTTTYVYKLYDDYDSDRPVFIGFSDNPRKEFKQLSHEWPTKQWQSIIPQRTEILPFPTQPQAIQMQDDLIDYYRPKYNNPNNP